MGMLDQEEMFMDGLAATAVGDTAGNSYDTAAGSSAANAANYPGTGDMGMTYENIWFQIVSRTVPTSGGAATLQGVMQSSPDGVTWTDAVLGPVIPIANITGPYHLLRTQPPVLQNPGMLRYIRPIIRIAGAALTGGVFDAYVSNTIQRNIPRPSGFTV